MPKNNRYSYLISFVTEDGVFDNCEISSDYAGLSWNNIKEIEMKMYAVYEKQVRVINFVRTRKGSENDDNKRRS